MYRVVISVKSQNRMKDLQICFQLLGPRENITLAHFSLYPKDHYCNFFPFQIVLCTILLVNLSNLSIKLCRKAVQWWEIKRRLKLFSCLACQSIYTPNLPFFCKISNWNKMEASCWLRGIWKKIFLRIRVGAVSMKDSIRGKKQNREED